jgi:hypothetical protein
LGRGSNHPEGIRAVTDLLTEALCIAPQFREGLGAGALDEDLRGLVGLPAFEKWRRSVLEGGCRMSDKKTY